MDEPMTIQHVYDGVYIGDVDALTNKKVLDELGITLVINCACELYMKRFKPQVQWLLYLPLEDAQPIPKDALVSALVAIKTFREQHKKVLVACCAGASRSASVVIASMLDAGWDFDKALAHIQKIRPVVNPSIEVIDSVKEYFGLNTQEYTTYG